MYLEQNLISQLLGAQRQEGAGEQCPPQGRSLAMVYAPVQEWQELYDPCAALQRGTQFAELDKPFCGAGGARNG